MTSVFVVHVYCHLISVLYLTGLQLVVDKLLVLCMYCVLYMYCVLCVVCVAWGP